MKKTTNNNETITVKVFGNAIAENIGIWDYSNTKKYSNWIGRMTDKDGKVEYFKKSYDEDLYFYFPKNLKAGDILKAGCTMIYKKRSESAYYAVIEVTEDSITLLKETTYLKATKAYNDYIEKMAAEEEEEEYPNNGAIDTVKFSVNNSTIKNTEDYSDKNNTTMKKKEYIKQLDNKNLERVAKELSEKNNIDIELFDDGMDDSMICVRIKSYFGYITVNENYDSLSNDDYLTLGIMINADADDDEEEMKHIWQLSALAEEENNLYYWTSIEEAAEAMIDIIKKNS